MQKKNVNVVTCPPCGENAGLPTKRGLLNKATSFTSPHRPYRALPPQVGKSATHGFTLIELLIVLLIIGILAAIALPQYQVAVEKSRIAEVMTNIATMKQQMELYILENGLPASGFVKYKDFANVELADGEWENSGCYITPHFRYCPSIGYRKAEIEVVEGKNDSYSFFASTTPFPGWNDDSPVGGWYHICLTQDTDLGRKICKHYEHLGWKYVDAEL